MASTTYDHENENWGDLLTAINGTGITYDAIGNMLNDGTRIYTWKEGRKLATLVKGSATWTFGYDANGMRTKKTAGSTTYNYTYHGSQLTHMTYGNIEMHFYYDASGRPLSVVYNGVTYYYVLNLQGDVVAILDSNGTQVVGYRYDAWGRPLATTGTNSSLALHNPLRYRGYVYDRETGLYYLESRYYNPEIGRFINADRYVSTGKGLLGYNMFVYCNNNPVKFVDYNGEFAETFLDETEDMFDYFAFMGGGACGGGSYHYKVDLSIAVRSASFGNGLLNGGWSSYSYTTPVYGKGGTDVCTGKGYGAGDMPVRIAGNWTKIDMKQALLGHSPRCLGSPDIHHGGQMPGGALHEVLPGQHRNNLALHPNTYNQGVTPGMRMEDRKLHWWYRAREQGADELLPDWIYD